MTSDAEWFERHRSSGYRLRPMKNGVSDAHAATTPRPPGKVTMTVVKQIMPGIVIRAAVHVIPDQCDCNECVWCIWDEAVPEDLQKSSVDIAFALLWRPAENADRTLTEPAQQKPASEERV